MTQLDAGDWITVKEAKDILGVTVRRIQQFIASGELKATLMGERLYLLLRSDVEAFKAIDRPKGRPPKSQPNQAAPKRRRKRKK